MTAVGPVRGADLGWVTEMEAAGRVFRDRSGRPTDPFRLMRDLGVQAIRLRVWVDPANGWNGREDVRIKARRATELGMDVFVNFHFSDSWADPGQQTLPRAWVGLGLDSLAGRVRSHVREILTTLRQDGIRPRWVQIGNETNDGMLWEAGRATRSMAGWASLFRAGAEVVRAELPEAKVVVHLSNGFDAELFRWNLDGLRQNGAWWDVIGMSIYPEPATWRSMVGQVLANQRSLVNRFGTPVMVAEVGMPWDSPDSTRELLRTLLRSADSLPPGSLEGVFYWEPASFPGWNGYTRGALDNQGRPTIALDAFAEQTARIEPVVRERLATHGLAVDAAGRKKPSGSIWRWGSPMDASGAR